MARGGSGRPRGAGGAARWLRHPCLAACAAAAGVRPARGEEASAALRALLGRLPPGELRDVDCDGVQGSLVDWRRLREQVRGLNQEFRRAQAPPRRSCAQARDADVVLARPAAAVAECGLGALSALLLLLVCASECVSETATSAAAAAFGSAWRTVLGGAQPLPAYMLGTSSWPVAQLLAKWQAHCVWRIEHGRPLADGGRGAVGRCPRREARAFAQKAHALVRATLVPLVWHNDSAKPRDPELGVFASAALPVLETFALRSATALPELAAVPGCGGAAATWGVLLALVRLLGPPVRRDPLGEPRVAELGGALASLAPAELLGGASLASAAALAAARHLAWRSHRLFTPGVPAGACSRAELRAALELGAESLRSAAGGGRQRRRGGLLQLLRWEPAARAALWEKVAGGGVPGAAGAGGAAGGLGPTWRRLAGWLLAGEGDVARRTATRICGQHGKACRGGGRHTGPAPGVVYLAMAFGLPDGRWLPAFLHRAIDVGLPRVIFITTDVSELLKCETIAKERDAEASLLCVHVFTEFARAYDHNNKAKFYLFPILLSLGMDVAWLDLDVFVIRDPTSQLLAQAYGTQPNSGVRPLDRQPQSQGPLDVVVTDHFDMYCLNHGVFMVRASDRSLLWLLEYIRWMHWYPFGHDQNGWDAFLGHSIVEPQVPPGLRTDPWRNASYGVLDTHTEYLTLTGWAGADARERRLALLIHFTTTKGISMAGKIGGLLRLFNATARRGGEAAPDARRVQMAVWKALQSMKVAMPRAKGPCYQGIHMALQTALESQLYDRLLA